MAQRALRSIHATFVRKLDPTVVHDLFSNGLLTSGEKDLIEAGRTTTEKNSAIMNALNKKDPERALQVLIQVLEGEDGVEKQANAHLLKEIAKGTNENNLLVTDTVKL